MFFVKIKWSIFIPISDFVFIRFLISVNFQFLFYSNCFVCTKIVSVRLIIGDSQWYVRNLNTVLLIQFFFYFIHYFSKTVCFLNYIYWYFSNNIYKFLSFNYWLFGKNRWPYLYQRFVTLLYSYIVLEHVITLHGTVHRKKGITQSLNFKLPRLISQ